MTEVKHTELVVDEADNEGEFGIFREGDWYPIVTVHAAPDALAIAHKLKASFDMEKALEGLLQNYLDLANSGDCGFWNPEEEEEVQVARAALAKARGEETPIPKCIHCDEEARFQLHGDDLCETHADDWMRGEGRVATKGEEK